MIGTHVGFPGRSSSPTPLEGVVKKEHSQHCCTRLLRSAFHPSSCNSPSPWLPTHSVLTPSGEMSSAAASGGAAGAAAAAGGAAGAPAKRSPSDFLKSVIGRPVTVHLASNSVIKGVLVSLDGFLNLVLEQSEEYVNGVLQNRYGDCLVRGNNGEGRGERGAGEEGEWLTRSGESRCRRDSVFCCLSVTFLRLQHERLSLCAALLVACAVHPFLPPLLWASPPLSLSLQSCTLVLLPARRSELQSRLRCLSSAGRDAASWALPASLLGRMLEGRRLTDTDTYDRWKGRHGPC